MILGDEEMLFCSSCDKEVDYSIKTKDCDFEVKDTLIKLSNVKIAHCVYCNNKLFEKNIDIENQDEAFRKYREIKKLIQPEEIIEIRKKYELTQKDYSKILGFGEITITRYENGSIPTNVQSQTIQLSKNPMTMKMLLEMNRGSVEVGVSEKLSQILDNLIKMK
jgi:putative zinc finger/helix-turn-helix YgiT family protein